jgi:hypothetical protein
MAVQARLILAERIRIECTIPNLASMSVFVFVCREVERPACNFRSGDVYRALLALGRRPMDKRNSIRAVNGDFYTREQKQSVRVSC